MILLFLLDQDRPHYTANTSPVTNPSKLYPKPWKMTTSIENVAQALKRVQRMGMSMPFLENWKSNTRASPSWHSHHCGQKLDTQTPKSSNIQFLENWKSNTRACLWRSHHRVQKLNTQTPKSEDIQHVPCTVNVIIEPGKNSTPKRPSLSKVIAMHCQCDHRIARDRAISQFWEEGDQIYFLVMAFAF